MKTTGITLKVKPGDYLPTYNAVVIPFKNSNSYLYKIKVDWGDGTVEEYDSGEPFSHARTTGTYIQHTYPNNNEYLIRISSANGRLPVLNYYFTIPQENSVKPLLSIKYSNVNWYDDDEATGDDDVSFKDCDNLIFVTASLVRTNPGVISYNQAFRHTAITSINRLFFHHSKAIQSLYSTFSYSNLTTLPEGLFRCGTSAHSSSGFNGTFAYCTSLTSIPSDLFVGFENAGYFSLAFRGCTALTSIPSTLFSPVVNLRSCNYMFENCSSLTGNAPELWNLYNVISYIDCFKDCTGLSNYNDIPNDWK